MKPLWSITITGQADGEDYKLQVACVNAPQIVSELVLNALEKIADKTSELEIQL